jgi:2-polyprenyl-3-methyl-5-hydroxy-6-metoxy-1,4-benzoquinol methylase
MPSFTHRSNKKELLDGEGLPFEDIRQNMQELDMINKLLGGHRITLAGIQSLVKTIPKQNDNVLHIVEIGCGGGDNLRIIKRWADNNQLQIELTGIDINNDCILYAENHPSNGGIQFICSDYRQLHFAEKPHIIFSALFCHHFTNQELISMMGWMQNQTAIGFFINDLHRHPLAYYSIKLLTNFFSKSRLVKNDAPLSVLRSFRKKDWRLIFNNAGITHYSIRWRWAFRWLLISSS